MMTQTYVSLLSKGPVKGNLKQEFYKVGMDMNYEGKLHYLKNL
jgi:hypothetical protein